MKVQVYWVIVIALAFIIDSIELLKDSGLPSCSAPI